MTGSGFGTNIMLKRSCISADWNFYRNNIIDFGVNCSDNHCVLQRGSRMGLIQQSDALGKLDGSVQMLRGACVAAWRDWLALPIEQRMEYTHTTRANIVHDKAISYAIKTLGQRCEVRELSGLRVFVFDQSIAVRIKKFDSDLRSRNQQTQQVRDFQNQQTLPGIPESFNLEIGYVLNRLQTEITGVYLVCPRGKKQHYWKVEISDAVPKSNTVELFDRSTEEATGQTKFGPKKADSAPKVIIFPRTEHDNDGGKSN